MLIAQITDLHLGFDGQNANDQNTQRFKDALAHIRGLSVKPDLLLITGDLVETGNNWAYENLKGLCSDMSIPSYFAMGNHDDREAFEAIFETGLFADGFLQYTIDTHDLRIIVLDTLDVGRHGAEFCDVRANWLSIVLAKQPNRPTIIAMHHPPIDTGISWLTASPDDAWVKRFERVISGYDNIIQILAGHIHRNIFQQLGPTNVAVSHAVAPRVSLDLAPIDPSIPDDRILLSNGTGGYSLHHWKDGKLTTHIVHLPAGDPIVRYDEKHAWVVRHTLDLEK